MLRRINQKLAQLPADLLEEKKAVAKLYNPCHKGAGQSAAYIEAAKAFNKKLSALGLLESLGVVEA